MARLVNTWKQTKALMRDALSALNLKSDKLLSFTTSDKSDELPILVLQEIFSFLSLPERLKCKRVSKWWKFAVENTAGPQSLCIYRGDYPCRLKWCFSESEVIPEDTISSDPEKFCNLNSRIELFRDVQKLCFFSYVDMSQFVNDLRLLKKLKVLMIGYYYIHHDDYRRDTHRHDPLIFDSKSLKKLSFKYHYSGLNCQSIESIDFATSNLSSLIFWNEHYGSMAEFPIRFRFPLTIRHLECLEFDSKLSVLRNLETLICQKIICPFKLSHFKSLQRLELFPKEEEELEYIRKIMDQKKRLGRDSLTITVCGFKDLLVFYNLEELQMPNLQVNRLSSFHLTNHYLRLVAEHPDKLVSHIPWEFNCWDFPNFYKISNRLPKDFLQKIQIYQIADLTNDTCRKVRKMRKNPPSASYMLHLVAESKAKKVAIFYNFDKEFYEQLTSIQTIKQLNIRERFENLEYDFFLRLEYLNELIIETEKIPIEFIRKVFKLKFFGNLYYYYSNFSFSVAQHQEQYALFKKVQAIKGTKVKEFVDETFVFDCMDDLIGELERMKIENKAYLRGCLL